MCSLKLKRIFAFSVVSILCMLQLLGQNTGVQTYLNPIQPQDHADQTLMKVGSDFYCTGSSFHYNPWVPIYHSTDLVHWEIIARVVPSSWAVNSDGPSAGIWQGALAQFGGKFWVYYSNTAGGGQYFSSATSMTGPWSAPTKVTGSTVTGYDNSIFVDDDGTPYMLMKNGQSINRMQQINTSTGQLTGTLMNMDWVNANNIYSWAEGPVMCKRNGRYYMFVAGNVTGGQYVLSSAKLSATESDWTRHGSFWPSAPSPGGFTGPNHVTQPIMLDDGSWWCLSHAYDNSGWYAQGRQCLLHKVNWDANGVPKGDPPSTNPVAAPNLPNPGKIQWNLPRDDFFSSATLNLNWCFFNKTTATKYSLSANPGYLRLTPGTATTHILQKEGGHYYTLVTKVTVSATATGQQAGLRLMNGKDDLFATLYVGNNGGAKIGFAYNGTATEVNNSVGNTVWLKLDRENHSIKGYYSADGKTWTQVGGTIDVSNLDKYSTNYNEWVGNAIALYATNVTADFDLFKYRDGFSNLKIAGMNNKYGVTTSAKSPGTVVTNAANGDWAMIGGVCMTDGTSGMSQIIVNAASSAGTGSLEVWIDNINGEGTKIATIPITASGGADTWKDYTASVSVTGQHDLYFKFVGAAGVFSLNTVRFAIDQGAPTVAITAPANNAVVAVNSAVTISATATDSDGSVSKVEFYQGTTLIGSDNSSPYSISWTPTAGGTYSITAVATDNSGKTATSGAVSIVVKAPQSPYGGTAWAIPGKIEFENFDEGGQDSAYYDSSVGSATGVVFRTDTDVDFETCTDTDGGYNIGYATAGEWMEYTVNVAATGVYTVTFRVACNGDGRTISLASDGTTIANNIAIPNTAGWQAWVDVKVDVTLTAGKHVLRLTLGATDYVNLNYMTFISASTLPPTVTSPVVYCQGATATALTAAGTALKWYTVATGGTALASAPVPSTVTAGSTTYYVSQTLNSIESARASIIVTVNATPSAPTVTTPVNYTVGDVATALSATGTALKWYSVATGGTVLASAPVPSTASAATVKYYVSQTVNTCESSRAEIVVVVSPVVVPTVSLKAGWNLVGCPIDGSTNIANALSSVWSQVESVKNADYYWHLTNTIPGLNTLLKLNWGEGYLIKVKADCELDWIVR